MKMPPLQEAIALLQKNRIPFSKSGTEGISTLLPKGEVDVERLRKLGFKVSRTIGGQFVVCYKGGRFGLVV